MRNITQLFLLTCMLLFAGHVMMAQCDSANYDPLLCETQITAFESVTQNQELQNTLATATNTFYMRSNVGNPWGQTTNQTAMNTAFGNGNWTEVFYETVDPTDVFNSETRFVFMEGSDGLANALNAFLQTNLPLIESWVASGKTLLLNAAPNQGGNINFGFDGSTLVYGGVNSASVTVVDTNHPAFLGPNLPVSSVMTGNSYAHSYITGTGFTTLLVNSTDPSRFVLREKPWGNGVVMMGGMTTTNFHSPNPEATNWRVNLLVYLESIPASIDCPSDIIVNNDPGTCGATVTFPNATATGSNGNPIPTTQTAGLASGSVFPLGDTLIEFTADDNGTTITCSFIITVEDNIDPVINCVGNQIVDTNSGECTYTHMGTAWDAVATDNSSAPLESYADINNWSATASRGTTSITYETVNGEEFLRLGYNGNGVPRNGTYVYTITADETETIEFDWNLGGCHSWFMSNASYRLWLNDTGNIIQTLYTGGGCFFGASGTSSFAVTAGTQWGIIVTGSHGDSADLLFGQFDIQINPCILTTSYELTGATTGTGTTLDGVTFNIGETTVTWTATDSSNNTDNCSFTVTVEDNEAPMAICAAPFTIQLDANGQASISVADIDFGSTDNCGIATIEIDRTDFDCTDLTSGSTGDFVYALYPWSATDNIYRYDFDPATLALSFESVAGSTGHNENFGFDVNPVTGEYYLIATAGSQRGLYTLDINTFATTLITPLTSTTGNTNAQDFAINNAGEFVILYQDGSVNKLDINTLATTLFATVSTPGGAVGFTYDYDNDRFLITNNYNPVTLSELTAAGVQNTLFTFVTPGTSANCTAQGIEYVGNGKCIASSTFSCDLLYSIDLNAESVDLIAQPNGSPQSNIKDLLFSPVSSNIHTVTLTVTDIHGNVSTCATQVTVEDNIAPEITCVPNQTIDTDAGVCTYTHSGIAWDATATDNCSVDTITYELTGATTGTGTTLDGVVFNLGETTVTWTATDSSDNTAICSYTVTVEDNEAPVITCITNQTTDTDPGVCTYTHNGTAWDATATDNCSVASITYVLTGATTGTGTTLDGEVFNLGETTVTWTATDGSTNTTVCSYTVTVEDNEAPIAMCAAPFTVFLDFFGNASITVADIDNGSTDNCGIASMTIAPSEFTCADIGDNVVTLTVTDNSGNVSTCTTIVTVEDNLPPQIVCPNDIVINAEPGTCEATVFFGPASAYDNCSGFIPTTQTAGPPSGSTFPIGETTITYTATDASGNTSSCSFTITVVDNQAPVAVCQNITIQLDADGLASITAEDLDGGSTDNCDSPLTFTASQTNFDCSNLGENIVTLTVTDAEGNSSTCTAIVTVEDNIAPVALCVAPFTIELDADGQATITAADIDAGSTDNCSIDTITLSQSTFTCADLGENIITLTVTDVAGNSTTCTTTVTVEDNSSPIVSCIDFTLELGADGTAILTPEDLGGTSTDNCAITITAIDIEEFDCSDIGTPVLVTYFASDASGNIASCTAMVTVVDNLGPVIDCPTDITVDTDPDSITYTVPDYFGEGIVTATDNCTDPVTIFTQTPAPGTLLLDGTYTVTLTATDEYGNESTCSFELTVDTILGAEDTIDFSSLTMYPNPAVNEVTIGNPMFMAIDKISVYDVQGRLVFSKNTKGDTGNQTINVSDLSSAVYMVVIESEGRQAVKRLIRK